MKFSTYFRRFLRQSSGAQKLYIQHRVFCQTFSATCHCCGRDVPSLPQPCSSFWAPDYGRRNRLKHVKHFTEINNLCNISFCWLYLKITYNIFTCSRLLYEKFGETNVFWISECLCLPCLIGLLTELNCQEVNFVLSLIRRDNGEQSRLQSFYGDKTVGVNRSAWRIL